MFLKKKDEVNLIHHEYTPCLFYPSFTIKTAKRYGHQVFFGYNT